MLRKLLRGEIIAQFCEWVKNKHENRRIFSEISKKMLFGAGIENTGKDDIINCIRMIIECVFKTAPQCLRDIGRVAVRFTSGNADTKEELQMAKKQFKAESKRLLDLMINSIYTHKEIFLREIISNASDAIDKLCYRSLTDEHVGMERSEFHIRIARDKEARLLTVSDNGIGMNREDLENNLGVIARSGSFQFKNELDPEKKADIDIIGQFGVGFYSAFMVSKKVTVRTRAYGSDTAYQWESTGADGYTITECDKESVGTDVIMELKEDTEDVKYSEYLDTWTIRGLIKKYSDYVHWPIIMEVEDVNRVETDELDEDGKPKTKIETTYQDETLNSMVPIWQRSRTEAPDEECMKFYREKFYDDKDPLAVIRVNAEGTVSYRAMLFIPQQAPYDYFTRDFKPGLQLYSSNVMIMENCADLLPDYFRFVRGVVDSQDLSLNISREMLQHDRQLRIIANNLEKKIKAELKKIMDERPEDYEKFFRIFGLQLKYGMTSYYGNNNKTVELLKDLLLFSCTGHEHMVSIRSYIAAMPEDQPAIYYIGAESVQRVEKLPQAEQIRDRGYEILCLTEDVDEFVIEMMGEYDGKKFCNINRDDLGLESEEEKTETAEKEEQNKALLDFVKETLGDDVYDVRLSHKLKRHPVCLSTDGDVTLEMEKYFAALPGFEKDKVKAKRVLEINGDHPAFAALASAYETDRDKAASLAKILLAQANIIAGLDIADPVEYAELVCSLF